MKSTHQRRWLRAARNFPFTPMKTPDISDCQIVIKPKIFDVVAKKNPNVLAPDSIIGALKSEEPLVFEREPDRDVSLDKT